MKTLLPLRSRFLLLLGLLALLNTACKRENPMDEAKLSDLAGAWVRIQSNNPDLDFMKVEVTGDRGVVTFVPGGSFAVNNVKWRDLTPSGSNTFDYDELGSDGSYYDAVLTLVNDSTLDIDVASTGAGNTQRWVKEGTQGTGGTNIQPVTLDCNYFTQARTLANSPAAIDYIVPTGCVLDVTAAVVIEPGVVIAFQENSGLGVYDNGSLRAVGTSTQPIVFQGATRTKGLWRGIYFDSPSLNNQLDHVVVEDAGGNYVYCCGDAATIRLHSGKLGIKNTTLRNGAGIGIIATVSGSFGAYENVTITTHDEYPAVFHLERVGETDGTGSDYSGNAQSYFFVEDGDMDSDVTWPKANIPYLLEGNVLDVTANLVIAAGTEIAMLEGAGIGVYDQGTFDVRGSAADPVVFRGFQAVAGYWRGVHIESNSLSNKIDHAVFSDAGSNYVYCCTDPATLYFKDGKCAVTNTTLRNGASYGILAQDAFAFTAYTNNTITTHAETPLYLAIERLGELDGTGSDYTGNSSDFVGVFNSDADDAFTWKKLNVPYLMDGVVYDLTARVDVEPGTEVVFKENGGLGVYDGGVFNAPGTSSDPIVFRGFNNVQGFWRGIYSETNSADNRITFATITNAGSNYVYCCHDAAAVYVKDGLMTVENSTITQSGGCGIGVAAAGTLTESGNTFSDNANGDICN